MKIAEKLTFVPAAEDGVQTGGNDPEIINANANEENPVVLTAKKTPAKSLQNNSDELVKDRDARLIEIIMRLALINGFDLSSFHIKDEKGNLVPNTNIIKLLKYAQLPLKVVQGEKDFVNLLKKAQVNPKLIVNQYIKQQLSNVVGSSKEIQNQQTQTAQEENDPKATFSKSNQSTNTDDSFGLDENNDEFEKQLSENEEDIPNSNVELMEAQATKRKRKIRDETLPTNSWLLPGQVFKKASVGTTKPTIQWITTPKHMLRNRNV